MTHRRLASLASLAAAALLGLGLAAPAAADGGGSAPPTVTQSAGSFTVSLPGVGSLTFMVDPTTGAVSNLVATADPGGTFTAGTPTVTDEGVQVTFTGAKGAVQALQVEVDREDGAVQVKAESDGDGGEAIGSAPSAPSATTSTTEAEHEVEKPNQATTSTTEADNENQNEGENDQRTTTTMAGGTTTTTAAPHEGTDSSGDGGTSTDGGSSDGGTSGGSADGGSGGGN